MKLVFGREAAQALGVSEWFVSSMKRAGAPFWGYKTDVVELEKWLRAHPGFIARHQWKAPQSRHPHRTASAADKPPVTAPVSCAYVIPTKHSAIKIAIFFMYVFVKFGAKNATSC